MISVLVPVYNVENYVGKTIESILRQTYADFELILVDDGSTDLSGKICDTYAKKDSRIKVYHQMNQGVSVARNTALKLSSGDYIIFIDSDDIINERMLERMKWYIEEYGCDIAVCKIAVRYTSGKEIIIPDYKVCDVLTSEKAMKKINLSKGMNASFCNKLLKAELLKDFHFEEGVVIGEDYGGLWDILKKAGNVVRCPEVLYYYMQRSNSVSYRGYTDKSVKVLENYRKIKSEAKNKYPNLYESTLAYELLQELAIIISMVKADTYDKELILDIRKEVKRELFQYLKIKDVPIHLKCCAVLVAIHYKLLTIPYRIFFKSRMTA